MYQFDKIKLVIWDLDDTFWKGTLSEGAVNIPVAHRELLDHLTDIGIVNSICSKNDFESTTDYLEKNGLAEYFVFPSIDWSPKGQRVKPLIADMQLRPANVLFLDDNLNADLTAKAAGMPVCGVYDESSKEYAEEMKAAADYYIYEFNELLDLEIVKKA